MLGVHALCVYLNVQDTRGMDGVQRLQESAHTIDGAEAESVLGEQRTTVYLVIESPASLQYVHSHSARNIAFRRLVIRYRLDDGAIGGEAKVEDDVLDFLR
jgi:hypothetical protein